MMTYSTELFSGVIEILSIATGLSVVALADWLLLLLHANDRSSSLPSGVLFSGLPIRQNRMTPGSPCLVVLRCHVICPQECGELLSSKICLTVMV